MKSSAEFPLWRCIDNEDPVARSSHMARTERLGMPNSMPFSHDWLSSNDKAWVLILLDHFVQPLFR